MAHVCECRWTSDQVSVVLEVQAENSRATSDSEPCSLGQLLRELENEGLVDVTVHGHHLERPASKVDEEALSVLASPQFFDS